MKGLLRDRPLEPLLQEITSRQPEGVLTVSRERVKKQICFLQGRVRFAASNLKEDRLGAFLRRSWALPEQVVREAENDLTQRQRLAERLLESGSITAEELQNEIRSHIFDIVLPVFDWRTGTYRYQPGIPNLVGELTSDIPVQELALERSRRQLSGAMIRKVLANPDKIAVARHFPERDLVQFSPPESLVLGLADSGVRVSKILDLAPDTESDIAQAAAALIACGLVSLTSAAPAASQPRGTKSQAGTHETAADATDGRASELLYYRQMHALLLGADHYKTLGLDKGCSADEVRRAYYRLAKEIHPDRFLTPPFDALHSEMEELFSQVLEAYKTLSQSESRERYDAERAGTAVPTKQETVDQQALARQNFLRGRTLFEEGKPAEALKFLDNAVRIEPDRAEYLRLLGTVQALNPRLRREAERNLLRTIELDPARAETYLQLGLLYRKLGQTDRAIQQLRECLRWDPANVKAGTALAEMTRTVGASS